MFDVAVCDSPHTGTTYEANRLLGLEVSFAAERQFRLTGNSSSGSLVTTVIEAVRIL